MLLLDTDVAVDLLRRRAPAIAWLSSRLDEEICLPGFVAMELIQGCSNRSEVVAVQKFAASFSLYWPSTAVADQALASYARGRLSHNLGLLDALIAALALSLNTPLYTFNQKHFAALGDLQTIRPYVR